MTIFHKDAAQGILHHNCHIQGDIEMIKVKTFGSQFKIFHITQELEDLDKQVTDFIAENNIGSVISISDATTTNTDGATMGIIRVMAYSD
jgi:hypothetical protein